MNDREIRKVEVQAYVYSRKEPTEQQKQKLQAFLENKYKKNVNLAWKEDKGAGNGFRIEVGTSVYKWNLDEIYDWSTEGRGRALKEEISKAVKNAENVIPLIKDTINSWQPQPFADEVGTVLTVGDGIATVSGLAGAEYGEILLFENGVKGMILDLKETEIGCVIFGDDSEIVEGSNVRRSKKVAGVPVGDELLGRVIDAMGNPIDGLGAINAESYYPIENPAPGIIDRQPVNKPMETGILAIDSMFPIGRGQRELIIGDRQTGKTAIALDTIFKPKRAKKCCLYLCCHRSKRFHRLHSWRKCFAKTEQWNIRLS